jgi:ribonuclease HI
MSHHIWRHRPLLYKLLHAYGINPDDLEKLPATARNPAKIGAIPNRIAIPKDKEASKHDDATAGEKVCIYTDSSAHNSQVGAAAILKQLGKQRRVLYYHLGTTEEHTVYKAELVGLLLGLQLIKTEQAGSVPIVLGVDNQAVIKAIQLELMHPRQHLAVMFLHTTLQIKGKHSTKYSLTLQWTAGHVGIPGNKEADMEARKAAEGLTLDTKLLPPML